MAQLLENALIFKPLFAVCDACFLSMKVGFNYKLFEGLSPLRLEDTHSWRTYAGPRFGKYCFSYHLKRSMIGPMVYAYWHYVAGIMLNWVNLGCGYILQLLLHVFSYCLAIYIIYIYIYIYIYMGKL